MEAGFLSPRDLEAALKTQAEHANAGRARKLGQVLLAGGRITATQLTQTLGMQLSVPWASLTHVEFEPALLARVPAEIAQKYKLIPVYVRLVKGHGETIYVAMEDPTNDVAIAEVAAHAKLPVRAMIASPTDVHRAIRLHYFGETPDDEGPVLEISEIEIPLKPRPRDSVPPPSASGSLATPPLPLKSSAPPPPLAPSVPAPPQSTITLLDGTSLAVPKRNLPAAGAPPPQTATAKSASAPPPPLALRPPSLAPAHPPPPAPAAANASRLARMKEGSEADRVVAATIAILVRKGLVTEAEIETELLRG